MNLGTKRDLQNFEMAQKNTVASVEFMSVVGTQATRDSRVHKNYFYGICWM